MIVAIDFDKTFTADTAAWSAVIRSLREEGHVVICVTGRTDSGQMGDQVRATFAREAIRIQVVFAGTQWKRKAAEEAGWEVDVWIDDSPEYIAEQHCLDGIKTIQ